MTVRFASRLFLLITGLFLVTTSVLGVPAALAARAPTGGTLLDRNQAGAVERGIETGDGTGASHGSPTPAVVLVFAGIVLLAALPPVQRVHVYHRPYHRSDWF
jgi:hypothetical protein